MAYDVNNPADVAALRAEVDNDPVGMGYTADDGDVGKLLDQLNLPENNVVPADGNAPMRADLFLDSIFNLAISSPNQFVINSMFATSNGFEEDLSFFRLKTIGLSNALSDAIDTIVRPLSRAEVLFAVDDSNGVKEFVTITNTDWAAARNL